MGYSPRINRMINKNFPIEATNYTDIIEGLLPRVKEKIGAFLLAIEKKQNFTISLFFKYFTNQEKQKALIQCAAKGYTAIVQQLINDKVSINTQDELGNTPLMLAIYNNHQSLAAFLLKYKEIDIQITNNNGQNILSIAHTINNTYIQSLIKDKIKDKIEELKRTQNNKTTSYRGLVDKKEKTQQPQQKPNTSNQIATPPNNGTTPSSNETQHLTKTQKRNMKKRLKKAKQRNAVTNVQNNTHTVTKR